MIAKILKSVKAHGSQNSDDLGQIYKIKLWNGNIITLGLDCSIKIWNQNLQLITSYPLFGYYQIAFDCDDNNFYIGDGNGNIRILDDKFNTLSSIKICQDIISDIKIYDEILAVVGHDGTFAIIQRSDYSIKKIQIQSQLYNIHKYNSYYYLGGINAYKINQNLSQIQQIQRANQFIDIQDQIFGVSDKLGVFKLKDQSATFQICDSCVKIGNNIVGVSDCGIKIYRSTECGISWKSELIQQFTIGYPKREIVRLDDKTIITGGDDGKIYKIQLTL